MKVILNFVLTIFFYLIVTPVAIILRWFQVDLIQQNLNSKAESYWETYQK